MLVLLFRLEDWAGFSCRALGCWADWRPSVLWEPYLPPSRGSSPPLWALSRLPLYRPPPAPVPPLNRAPPPGAKREPLNRVLPGLQADLDAERSARETLEPLRPLEEEAARLRAENAALAPDAKAYAQLRERLGAIECEARKRADDLEAAAHERMRQTVELFQSQYSALMSTF